MATRERPLSPHLQVYRWQITMVMSILHRATGIALTVGALGFAWWLVCMAQPDQGAETAMDIVSSPIGIVFLFLFSLSLVFHTLNGIRHLLWDAGRGYDIPEVYKTGYTVAVLTVVLTAALWFLALGGA
jgi:succinate dehydrogenase / fumarate reductase, cytochrome b subunit